MGRKSAATVHSPRRGARGANRFSGAHVGADGVGQLLGGMMEVSGGTFQLAVTGPAMVNGELVVVPVRFSGQREGASMDMGGVDLLTIRDGRIVEVHLFSEDGRAEDTFWGQTVVVHTKGPI